MVPWRGNLSFRVYNPDKPVKYGIKEYMICGSGNGYCSKIRLYTGRSNQPVSDKGRTYDLVMDMMSGYCGRNHVLFCDNYYSSHRLFIDLWQLGVGATGTVRQKGVSQVIKGRKLSRKGETVVYKSRQLTITKYFDAKPVFVMSSVYPSDNIPTGKTDPRTHMPVTRPQVVVMYNKMMGVGEVDRSDQMLAYSQIPVKNMKWWKNFFSHSQHVCAKRLHNLKGIYTWFQSYVPSCIST